MFENLLSLAIRLAGAAVVLGWGLSALGGINGRGYLLAGLPVLGLILFSIEWQPWTPFRRVALSRPLGWWKRRRALPRSFLLVTGLVLLGSVLHEPNNYDGLNYRAPKVLNWLEAHRWHWIHSSCAAVNWSFPNYEWLSVPFYLLTGGFHATVVINWIAFALLPGLFFSLLRVLGASSRLAYDWMWIFPSGYVIALLAGGIGNDLVGLTALLASIHCASRFNVTNKGGYLLDALLAAGFCTGVKISNLPLGAFVLLVLLKHPFRLLTHRTVLAAGTVLGLAGSGLIPLLLNRLHTGSILGVTASSDQTTHPVAGWLGNALALIETAFAPPLGGGHATAWLDAQAPGGLLGWIHAHYPKFSLRMGDLPQEEGGGLGIGITLCVLLCVGWSWRMRRPKDHPGGASPSKLLGWQRKLFVGWLVFALLVILAKLGLAQSLPRVLIPWLGLMVAALLAGLCNEAVTRARLWRRLAPLLTLSVVPVLLLTPSRPLVPPSAVLWLGHKLGLSEPTLRQIQVGYEVYAHRADPFVELRQSLPPETPLLAVVSDGFDLTAAYWKPYTKRRCVDWLSDQEVRAALAQSSQPLYVVLKEDGCQHYFHLDTAGWLQTYGATPLKSVDIRVFASRPPFHFTLARLEPQGAPR